MLRSLASVSPAQLRKWGGCALLVLVTPGSFILLPAYWLYRRLAAARLPLPGNPAASRHP